MILSRRLCVFFSMRVIAGLLLVPLSSILAEGTLNLDPNAMDVFLKSRVAAYHIPGLAVVVVQDDQIVFVNGYGQAGQNRPVTPRTQFYLGSVSKSFTALAAMQLVDQGKLELDAPVQRYLPWFQVADAQASRQITVRHLLNHTSGLSEGADPGAVDYQPTLTEQVRRMRIARLTAPVGSKYQYNSQNYRVLSLLVEQVGGQPYPDYLRDHIFAPLDMIHSAASPDLAPDLAQGHGQVLGLPFPRPQVFQPAGLGSGYLISSAEDMGKYMIAMLNQGRYAGQTLVQAQSFIQMLTPPEGIKSEYGMGWVITTTTGGKKLVYHGGSIANFHSMVMMLPEERLGLAFLSNQNGILPMLTGLQAVKVGLLNLLVGEPVPQSAFYDWIYWLLAAIVALDLGMQIYRIVRLPKWLGKLSRQPALVRWLRALVDLIVPAALFFGLPAFLNAALDGSASRPSAYDLIPDVTLWLLTNFTLSVVRGAAKLILISRREGPATVSVVLRGERFALGTNLACKCKRFGCPGLQNEPF